MKKAEVQQRVLQNGKPLAMDKFEWDENANAFSTSENELVIDFGWEINITFSTGSYCTFKTGSGCTFKTGSGCIFDTDSGCVFNTDFGCTFNTNFCCTFNTGSGCTFNTGLGCVFKTDSDCIFSTGSYCTFKVSLRCVAVRRDVYEVIEFDKLHLSDGQVVVLNGEGIAGHTIQPLNHKIVIDGKEIEIGEEGYRAFKNSLI